jgi:hypothetical protein
MSKQSNLSGFLNNVDQSGKITGLVEDIRDAILDYQACCSDTHIAFRVKLTDDPKTSLQQDLNDSLSRLIVRVLTACRLCHLT